MWRLPCFQLELFRPCPKGVSTQKMDSLSCSRSKLLPNLPEVDLGNSLWPMLKLTGPESSGPIRTYFPSSGSPRPPCRTRRQTAFCTGIHEDVLSLLAKTKRVCPGKP